VSLNVKCSRTNITEGDLKAIYHFKKTNNTKEALKFS